MVLDDSPPKNDHTHPLRIDSDVIDSADVSRDTDIKNLWRSLESMKVEHVAQATVGQGRTENRNIVPVCPVVH